MVARYSGYISCPLGTGYGSLILAEFDYDKQPEDSLPFDQSQERYRMYALTAYALPVFRLLTYTLHPLRAIGHIWSPGIIGDLVGSPQWSRRQGLV